MAGDVVLDPKKIEYDYGSTNILQLEKRYWA